jgi:hypothetical protein
MEVEAGRQSLVEVVDTSAVRQLAAPETIGRALDLPAGAEPLLIVIGEGVPALPATWR